MKLFLFVRSCLFKSKRTRWVLPCFLLPLLPSPGWDASPVSNHMLPQHIIRFKREWLGHQNYAITDIGKRACFTRERRFVYIAKQKQKTKQKQNKIIIKKKTNKQAKNNVVSCLFIIGSELCQVILSWWCSTTRLGGPEGMLSLENVDF